MQVKLRRGGHRSRYRLRKQTVEPVFGQIKQARGFRQVLLRGIEKVTQEWSLVCCQGASNFPQFGARKFPASVMLPLTLPRRVPVRP